jgi:hypothetical protein
MALDVTMTQGFANPAFTFTSNVAADDTVVIGDKTYTFKAAPSAAYEVDVGADLTASVNNLAKAINLSGTAVTEYGASHVEAHPLVTGANGGDDVSIDLTGRGAGIFFDSIYLAATSPGANSINVGGVTCAAAITAGAGTNGAGSMDAFIAGLFSLNQLNSEVYAALAKLTDAAD